jgi:hypothetical protein
METKIYTYTIGSKNYTMKPLVMGQVNQLITLLKDSNIPETGEIMGILLAIGDKLPNAVAIVLHDPDVSLKDKNVEALANEIAFELSPEMFLQVAEDFFECTPIYSLFKKMGDTAQKIVEKMTQTQNGLVE